MYVTSTFTKRAMATCGLFFSIEHTDESLKLFSNSWVHAWNMGLGDSCSFPLIDVSSGTSFGLLLTTSLSVATLLSM